MGVSMGLSVPISPVRGCTVGKLRLLGVAQQLYHPDSLAGLAGNAGDALGGIEIAIGARQTFEFLAGRRRLAGADIGAHRFERMDCIGKRSAVGGDRQPFDILDRGRRFRLKQAENTLKKRPIGAYSADLAKDLAVDHRLIGFPDHG